MKQYNVKYNIQQKVFILTNKSVYETVIDQIRVTERAPFVKLIGTELVNNDGILIEYLVEISSEPYSRLGSTMSSYDWYPQEDVYTDKEELIRNII